MPFQVPCSWFRVRVLSSSSEFKVPGSGFERTWNVEPGTLNRNLEHERGTWNPERGTAEIAMKRSLRSWLWRVDITQEVDEEIEFHIEMRTRELVDRGVDPRVAREMVLARLGDVGRLKRTCVDLGRKRDREMRLTQFIEEFRADVTSAFRQMRASPGLHSWSPRSRWRSASAPTARSLRLPTRRSCGRCRSPRRTIDWSWCGSATRTGSSRK